MQIITFWMLLPDQANAKQSRELGTSSPTPAAAAPSLHWEQIKTFMEVGSAHRISQTLSLQSFLLSPEPLSEADSSTKPQVTPSARGIWFVCRVEQCPVDEGEMVLLTTDRSSWIKPRQHHCTAHFCIALQLQNIIELFGFWVPFHCKCNINEPYWASPNNNRDMNKKLPLTVLILREPS